MSLGFFAPQYMTRFQCIGADCEDDCCTGWAMPVDEAHYTALQARMSATPAEADEFAAAVRREEPPRPNRYALMVLREEHRCAMLGDDQLCRIQARYGEPLLPNVCAVYPRVVGHVTGHIELSGNVSCPEIARVCLLADDALEIVPIERERIVRELVFHNQGKEPYDAALHPVRGALWSLLGVSEFPLATRLFFIASLAERTRAWLRRGGAIDGTKLGAALDPLRRIEVLRTLARDFAKVRSEDPFPMTLVHQVLTSRLERAPRTFLRICAQVADSYGPAMDEPPQLWTQHRKRAAALPPAVSARLDDALTRYCRNFTFQEWFTREPRLLDHVHSLAIRMAVLRFLLVSHPLLATQTDRALVEVVYSFTRTFDHEEQGIRDVLAQLAEKRNDTLRHVATLLKV